MMRDGRCFTIKKLFSLKQPLRLFAMVAVVMAVAAWSPLQADPVTYSIEGSFDGGPADFTPSLTFGSGPDTATIAFTGISLTTASAPNSFNYGTFQTSTTGLGATLPGGTTFTYYIYQTVPATDMVTFSATFSGTISFNSSSAFANFGNGIDTASGPVTWGAPGLVALSPPASSGGIVTSGGPIATVPEPSTYALLICGLGFIGFIFRHRRSIC